MEAVEKFGLLKDEVEGLLAERDEAYLELLAVPDAAGGFPISRAKNCGPYACCEPCNRNISCLIRRCTSFNAAPRHRSCSGGEGWRTHISRWGGRKQTSRKRSVPGVLWPPRLTTAFRSMMDRDGEMQA